MSDCLILYLLDHKACIAGGESTKIPARCTLSIMAAGDTSQTTLVKIMYVLCCVVLLKLCMCIVIPVRILLVTWCVLID